MRNPALLFWKQRTRLGFPLRNRCCCWSQFPAAGSAAVTAAAPARGIFSSLLLFLMLQTKGEEAPLQRILNLERFIFFPSKKFLNIEFKFCFLHQGGTWQFPGAGSKKKIQGPGEGRIAPGASSSRTVYFQSAMRNCLQIPQGKKCRI